MHEEAVLREKAIQKLTQKLQKEPSEDEILDEIESIKEQEWVAKKKAQLLSIFWVVGHLRAYENSGLKCPMGGTWLTASKDPKMQHRCFRKMEKSHFCHYDINFCAIIMKFGTNLVY